MAFKSVLSYGTAVLDDTITCEIWANRVGLEAGKILTPPCTWSD